MFEKILNSYSNLFDKQIWDSTVVVWIIASMIFFAWLYQKNSSFSIIKSNIIEYKYASYYNDKTNIIIISWKKYKILLQEIK